MDLEDFDIDNMLLKLAQDHEDGIQDFMDTFFLFLARKTDNYTLVGIEKYKKIIIEKFGFYGDSGGGGQIVLNYEEDHQSQDQNEVELKPFTFADHLEEVGKIYNGNRIEVNGHNDNVHVIRNQEQGHSSSSSVVNGGSDPEVEKVAEVEVETDDEIEKLEKELESTLKKSRTSSESEPHFTNDKDKGKGDSIEVNDKKLNDNTSSTINNSKNVENQNQAFFTPTTTQQQQVSQNQQVTQNQNQFQQPSFITQQQQQPLVYNQVPQNHQQQQQQEQQQPLNLGYNQNSILKENQPGRANLVSKRPMYANANANLIIRKGSNENILNQNQQQHQQQPNYYGGNQQQQNYQQQQQIPGVLFDPPTIQYNPVPMANLTGPLTAPSTQPPVYNQSHMPQQDFQQQNQQQQQPTNFSNYSQNSIVSEVLKDPSSSTKASTSSISKRPSYINANANLVSRKNSNENITNYQQQPQQQLYGSIQQHQQQQNGFYLPPAVSQQPTSTMSNFQPNQNQIDSVYNPSNSITNTNMGIQQQQYQQQQQQQQQQQPQLPPFNLEECTPGWNDPPLVKQKVKSSSTLPAQNQNQPNIFVPSAPTQLQQQQQFNPGGIRQLQPFNPASMQGQYGHGQQGQYGQPQQHNPTAAPPPTHPYFNPYGCTSRMN